MVIPFTKVARYARAVLTIGFVSLPILLSSAQTAPSDPPYSVVDRGAFYRVLQRTVSVTNVTTGEVSQQVQSYTELADGMNYLSNGQWIEAQDLVEAAPGGAQAVHGQMTGTFNSDITSKGAISLTTAGGEVFQSHPIGLFYADSVSGKMARIGSVQSSVGTLYPPNVIVFSNVLSGVRADLMLVWARNGYEQNLVLKQSPPKPESFGLSSSSTTLQLWSAMDSCPVPQEQRPVFLDSGLEDHILIFGSAWFPVGAAFVLGETPVPPSGQAAQIHLVRPGEPGTVPVAKSLANIAGQQVLIEEVSYTDLSPALSQLPQASLSPQGGQTALLADRGTFLAPQSKTAAASQPLQVASTQYTPNGVILDYVELTGSPSTFTFSNGVTYHIASTFGTGPGTAYFQQNACLKFDTNAYLLVYGNVSCSTSGSPTVFTSRDDNAYGAIITNSTANPGYAVAQELWLYYETTATTVQNSMFRWAQRCTQYDENSGVYISPSLNSCVFQDSQTGVYANLTADTLYLTSDTQCNVVTPIQKASGSVSGSIKVDCGVVSVAMVNDTNRDLSGLDTNKNSQSECSFVVLPDGSNVVAAFFNTHLSEYALGFYGYAFPGISSPRSVGWATSSNSGSVFLDRGPIPPSSPLPTQGDAGDPVVAYDPNGNIYLLVNPSREGNYNGFRLWKSTDKGASFTLINTNVPGGVTSADKPMLKVTTANNLYVSGKGSGPTIWASHSSNGGTTWDTYTNLDNTGAQVDGPDIGIGSDGTLYAFWVRSTGSGPTYVNSIRYAWLVPGGQWSASAIFGTNLNSSGLFGTGKLLRSKNASSTDFFDSNAFPRIAVANGRIYVVYADLPYPGSVTDRGDIWIAEGLTNLDHSLTLNSKRRVNNDTTSTDQWDPSIVSNPFGTELFIGYYSRQNDPANSYIMAYGAKAFITNGLANATFECIPISPTAFQPMFAGTSTPAADSWAYDPVWPQGYVCLDTNAVYQGTSGGNEICGNQALNNGTGTDFTYINFCADDYTWAAADTSYFYFAWCDRSRTNGTPPTARPDADIKFAKIRQ